MDHLARLLSLDGHAFFLWAAWLPCLALLATEALLVRRRLRRARAEAAQRVMEEAA
jgi:heme exporter protein CcmD